MHQPAHERQTVEELRKREERHRSLFAKATEGVFIVSREGRFVAVNPTFGELIGLPPEELVGQPIEILLRGGFAQSLERIEQTIREGILGPYELEVTTPVGPKVFSVNSFTYCEGGSLVGIMCIAHDITVEHDRKEQEALCQLAHDLARASDIGAVAAHLFTQTQRLLRADYGFLLLADAEGHTLRGVAAYGVDNEAFCRERIEMHTEVAPATHAFQQKQPVVVKDFAHSPLVSERLRQQYSFLGSLWVSPLMNGDEAIGAFAVGYAAPREATAAELRLLQLLGDEAAMAVKRAHLTHALQEREEHYRNLFENTTDSIATFTLDSTITSVNRGLEVALDWSREELIGQRYHTICTPASIAHGEARTRRGLAGEKLSPTFEAEMVRKDGSVIVVDIQDRFIRNSQGDPIGVQVIFRDITARKRTEEALRESQERLRTVITGAPIILFATDHTGMVTLSEGKGLEVLGRTPGDSVGRSVFALYRDLPQIGDNMRRALAGETFTATVEVGRATFEIWHSPLRGPNGAVTGVIGVSTDITERKRAEEERDRFFTLALDMFGIAGSDSYFKRVNPAFERTLGFTSAELLAAPFLAFVHPDDRAATTTELQKLISGTSTCGFENRYRCKDGSYKWLAWNATLAEDGLLYTTARDITARKQTEAALQRAPKELERWDTERTDELR